MLQKEGNLTKNIYHSTVPFEETFLALPSQSMEGSWTKTSIVAIKICLSFLKARKA